MNVDDWQYNYWYNYIDSSSCSCSFYNKNPSICFCRVYFVAIIAVVGFWAYKKFIK